jgi:hypothetical protein
VFGGSEEKQRKRIKVLCGERWTLMASYQATTSNIHHHDDDVVYGTNSKPSTLITRINQ